MGIVLQALKFVSAGFREGMRCGARSGDRVEAVCPGWCGPVPVVSCLIEGTVTRRALSPFCQTILSRELFGKRSSGPLLDLSPIAPCRPTPRKPLKLSV